MTYVDPGEAKKKKCKVFFPEIFIKLRSLSLCKVCIINLKTNRDDLEKKRKKDLGGFVRTKSAFWPFLPFLRFLRFVRFFFFGGGLSWVLGLGPQPKEPKEGEPTPSRGDPKEKSMILTYLYEYISAREQY